MKKWLLLVCVVLLGRTASAERPALRFDKNGRFRIAQFTDMHLDLSTAYRKAEAEKTLAQLRDVLRAEHPDLVLFTGDVVTGKPAAEAWHKVLDAVAETATPFCVVLGNHDAEQDLSREQIARIVTAYAGSVNRCAAGELDDVALEIGGRKSPAAVLYCLDSHDYSTLKEVEGYGWFSPKQIARYRAWSAAYTAANGGEPLPALAFFHIPLPEYGAAWRNPRNSRIGRAAEEECPGAVNTGMFAAMVEAGDVAGIFVGHDHDIDYAVAEKGVALVYGRFSGDDTTYHNLRPGVRIITLTEGQRGFESWIRERDGRVVDHMAFRDGKVEKVK